MNTKSKELVRSLKENRDKLEKEIERTRSIAKNIENELRKYAHNYNALVGTLMHLHRKFADSDSNCEPLEHALAAAQLIENNDVTPDISDSMEKLGRAFLRNDSEKMSWNN